METNYGRNFATLSVQLPAGPIRKHPTGSSARSFEKNKSPSRHRRDRERMERFRAAKPSKVTPDVSRINEPNLRTDIETLPENTLENTIEKHPLPEKNTEKFIPENTIEKLPLLIAEKSPEIIAEKSPESTTENIQEKSSIKSPENIAKTSQHNESVQWKSFIEEARALQLQMMKMSKDFSSKTVDDKAEPNEEFFDTSEDPLFEEAAMWAKKQKKLCKM